MKPHLLRMFRYMTWADQQTLAAVRDCPPAHAEALPLYAHILAAEHVWLSRLLQRTPQFSVWPTIALDDCSRLAEENAAGYRDFVTPLAAEGLTEIVSYRNMKGDPFTTPIIDILTQVLTHGPYHRGQIAKILGRHGGAVPSTDYITYAREVEPLQS
ncbi:DinB family protein [Anatilimnocola floriformis]|uniref:DinB family protein n=1 Tax=Anatilimnocola floriformis TaxID=2948575 RepID=UPI0020C42BEA|nr:DinB family protein [Anatilimnocola floriformis]